MTIVIDDYRACPGAGMAWRGSVLFGIPLCPECLESWSRLGLAREPALNGLVPPHQRSRLLVLR